MKTIMKTIRESVFKGALSRCEVESLVKPLRDKEPTPAWRKQFKEVLKHYGVSLTSLSQLTASSNKVNLLGRRYGEQSLQGLLANYNDGHNGWTKNGFRTINDHLDVLVDYLSKPEEEEEDEHVPTLRERLEKERAEGKWPSVDERIKEQENNISKYACDDIQTTQDLVDATDTSHKVHLHRIKKHKKHRKSNNIYITIKIGR